MTDLDFIKDQRGDDLRKTNYFSGLGNFWTLEDDEIPWSPGAYVLLARGTHFRYPLGTNSVYYIGQSKKLRRRLRRHVWFATQARNDRQRPLYKAIHEYAASYGTHYCFVRTWQGMSPKALEEVLMAHFAGMHHCFPVANRAGGWGRINRLLTD